MKKIIHLILLGLLIYPTIKTEFDYTSKRIIHYNTHDRSNESNMSNMSDGSNASYTSDDSENDIAADIVHAYCQNDIQFLKDLLEKNPQNIPDSIVLDIIDTEEYLENNPTYTKNFISLCLQAPLVTIKILDNDNNTVIHRSLYNLWLMTWSLIFCEYDENDNNQELENTLCNYVDNMEQLVVFFLQKGVNKKLKNDDDLTAAEFVLSFIKELKAPYIEFSLLALFGFEYRLHLNQKFVKKIEQKLMKIYKKLL